MATRLRLCFVRCSSANSNIRIFHSLQAKNKTSNMTKKLLPTMRFLPSSVFLDCNKFSILACQRGESEHVTDSRSGACYKRTLSPARFCHFPTWCQKRFMAGHSHWQNIKHIKGARDRILADAASRTMKNIVIAVKAGGGDPRFNKELARAMDAGIKQGVTKARVNEMVEKAVAKSKEFQKHICLVQGPQGCIFVVEVFTDNVNKVKTQLSSLLKKTGGKLTNTGRETFDEKGVVEVPVTVEMEPVDMDKYLEIAIEAGAEDVILMEEENEDGEMKKVLKFHCNPLHVSGVKKEIESHDIEVSSAESDFIPLHWVTLDGVELTVAQAIYQKLCEHEDITRVFDNVNTPEE